MELLDEVFLPIAEFDGYEISNYGRVRSFRSLSGNGELSIEPRIIKQRKNKNGYLQAGIRKMGKKYNLLVNRLVATVFHGKPENDKMVAAHLNGIRDDNRSGNIKWCTVKENCAHKIIHGTKLSGEKHPGSKLKTEDILMIRAFLKEGLLTEKEVGLCFGVDKTNINSIKRGKTWGHVVDKNNGGQR